LTGKPRGNGILHIYAGEEIRPTDAAWPAHIGGIQMQKLDRRDSGTDPFENEVLEGNVVVVVILWASTALYSRRPHVP
jgi:hypothetical protein